MKTSIGKQNNQTLKDIGYENLRENIRIYLYVNPKESIHGLSKKCGISHATVYQFMKNKNKVIGSSIIEKFCVYLGLTISELFSNPSVFLEKISSLKESRNV